MFVMKRKNIFVTTCLALLILGHFLVNFYWLRLDSAPHDGDTGAHLNSAFFTAHALYEPLTQTTNFFCFLSCLQNVELGDPKVAYGPIMRFLPIVFNGSSFENFYFNARFFTNGIFLIVLVLATFLSGVCLFDNKTGLLAAFFVSFIPECFGFARQFEFEFGIAAFFSLALFLLVSRRSKQSFFKTVCTGIIIGLGTLVKMQFLFFLFFPFAYVFYEEYRIGKGRRQRTFWDAVTIVGISATVSLCYFGENIYWLCLHAYKHVFGLYPLFRGNEDGIVFNPNIPDVFSFKGWFFYAIALMYQLGFVFAGLSLYSCVRMFFTRHSARILLIGSILSPYVIYTFISVKWMRYIFPVIVPLALVSAWSLCSIKRRNVRRSAIAGIVLYALTSFVYLSFFKAKYAASNENPIIGYDYGYARTHRPIQIEDAIFSENDIRHMRDLVRQKGFLLIGISDSIDLQGDLAFFLDELCKSFSGDFNIGQCRFEFIDRNDIDLDVDYLCANISIMHDLCDRHLANFIIVKRLSYGTVILRKV
jgi:hypothetical protein